MDLQSTAVGGPETARRLHVGLAGIDGSVLEEAGCGGCFASEDGFVDRNEHESHGGEGGFVRGKQKGKENDDKANEGVAEFLPEVDGGEATFERGEFEAVALAPGVGVHGGEDEVDGGESDGVEEGELADLGGGIDDHAGAEEGSEHELERVYVKENAEEQKSVEPDGSHVVRAVAAKELVVGKPHKHEHEEGYGKGEEAAKEIVKIGEGLRDVERDDDKGEREAEDDVGEAVDAGHLGPAEAETVFGYVVVEGLHGEQANRLEASEQGTADS